MFILASLNDANSTVNSHRKYFLPRVVIENYNIEIDGRNYYYQPINDLIKQYDKVRKISARHGHDYTTGCLLDFAYFKKQLQTNCYWFKQTKSIRCIFKSKLDSSTGKTSQAAIIYYIYEKSKEAIL